MPSLIRQDDKNVPIIFLTAYDSDENMFEAIELGDFGVFKKSFSFNAFSRELFKDGVSIALTKKEQNLLHLLLKNNGKTMSFEMI